jgi:hypothetical protein
MPTGKKGNLGIIRQANKREKTEELIDMPAPTKGDGGDDNREEASWTKYEETHEK